MLTPRPDREASKRHVCKPFRKFLRTGNAALANFLLGAPIRNGNSNCHELTRPIKLCADRHPAIAMTGCRYMLIELCMGDFHRSILPGYAHFYATRVLGRGTQVQ
jgi:hypothetical protein